MILTIVTGIIVLSVLVLIHELGHYITAKATGCWVKEFGIGMRPRLWGKKYGETIYSINWVPFGGFNDISGEVDPAEPRALAARSHAIRALVISGGIILNLLVPFLLMTVAYMVPHDVVDGQVIIRELAPNSPAELSGLQVGDTILSVDGKEIRSVSDLSRAVQTKLGTEIDIEVERESGALDMVSLVPRWRPPEGQGAIGTLSETVNAEIVKESLPIWKAIPQGFSSCWEMLILYRNGIAGMIIGVVPFTPAGPVGIVQVAGEIAHSGFSPLLELTAFISVAVGVTQLIPFPALDGGRLLFILIEWLRRGKRISPKVENMVHSVGFFILIALMVVITYEDIARWASGGSLMGG